MTDSDQPGNPYARELVQILAEHGLNLADLATPRVGLDPATVERLRLSLTNSRLFPVLGPDEQELLVAGLLLNATEQRRLLAALLATAIQRLLKDQIGLVGAHQFIAQTYSFLLTASLQADLDTLGSRDRTQDHGPLEDQTWRTIWDAIESAALSLQMSNGRGLSYSERVRYLYEARTRLEEAMADMESLNADGRASPIWHTCHHEASKTLKAVTRNLRQLESKQ